MLAGELPVADRHYSEIRRLEAFAVALLRRAWSRVDMNNVVESWAREVSRVFAPFVNLQLQAATLGATYAAAALIAQGVRVHAEAKVRPEALAGWASDGRPLESLLRAPADVATQMLDPARTAEAGRASAARIARTQIADAARIAAGVDRVTRPRVGWVRMLSPPSCDKCLILAGRFYRWSDGFDRHPNDDCTSVPAAEDRPGDLRTDPDAYLKSLSVLEQDRLLGKHNAQAWREGADLNQLVNAKRGMATTADGVRTPVLTADGLQATTTGTTNRALAGKRLRGEQRLVPESIYRIAVDRADALRLLKLHGYVL